MPEKKTAPKQITDSDTQRKKTLTAQNKAVVQRTTETTTAAGLHPGKKRDNTKDRINEATLRSIEQSREKVNRDNRNNIITKRKQEDTNRALQKLQSRCNHKYDTTKRCTLCGKHRNSHRFD